MRVVVYRLPIAARPVLLGCSVALLLLTWVGVRPARADETTRQVQEELRKRDLYFGDVDGQASTQLAAALRRYQERKGFPTTGEPDEQTLSSLNLLRPGQTPPPRLAAATPGGPGASTPATPPPLDAAGDPGTPTTAWPDVVVLRSDEARPPLGSAGAETPAPTPAPPPASATMSRRPPVDAVRAYVARYLQAGQTNDPDAELRFYGERVAYFDEGTVDHAYIIRSVNYYDHRWPDRHFTLLDPVTVADAPDGDPARFVVNFRMAFTVRNSRYNVTGKTDNTWIVAGNSPAEWHIVSMKEQRVRAK